MLWCNNCSLHPFLFAFFVISYTKVFLPFFVSWVYKIFLISGKFTNNVFIIYKAMNLVYIAITYYIVKILQLDRGVYLAKTFSWSLFINWVCLILGSSIQSWVIINQNMVQEAISVATA